MTKAKNKYIMGLKGGQVVLGDIPAPNLPVGSLLDYTRNKGKERNAPLANYCGPGTLYSSRVSGKPPFKNFIKPTTNTDWHCMNHDYEYSKIHKGLRLNNISQAKAKKLARTADKKLRMGALKNTLSPNPVESTLAKGTALGMTGKMTSEDLGLLDPLKYVKPKEGGKKDPVKKLINKMNPTK